MKRRFTLFAAICCGLFLISGTIDLDDLFDYENMDVPDYITKDNTPNANPITDAGATLGRVLFYDKQLSRNNTVSCASCHQQEFAFGDTATVSIGWDGATTGRHTPRLINARFGEEEKFFWDERADDLEEQSTMPIKNHDEMGFSGTNGDPGIDSLISKMEGLSYYQELFDFVYGDFNITENEIQDALAQFMRSIQSFDSKYDEGRAQVGNDNASFPNFTTQENEGKTLFMQSANNDGANCNTCHAAPEFDIDDNSDNNSVITVANSPGSVDVTNTRSPTLRDMVNPDGSLNGPLMHDGSFTSLMDVVNLYDDITVDPDNSNLDNRLQGGGGGNGQNLNLTQTEKDALVAFLETLTGTEVYTAEQWSDPFDVDGNITILNSPLPVELISFEVSLLGKDVQLGWQTASEEGNRGFEIQHSLDAINWSGLDFVDGVGDSYAINEYAYLHETPPAGDNYYRLLQVDYDGKGNFSKTLSEYIDREDIALTVYPNPVQNNLQVQLPSGSFNATIVNLQGKILDHLDISDGENIDMSKYEAGIYFLRIRNETGQERMERIIKM